jgi:hypothetical protein
MRTFALAVATWLAEGTLVAYPSTPGAVIDTRFTFIAGSVGLSQPQQLSIALEREAGCDVRAVGPPPRPSTRARFASDGPVGCTIALRVNVSDSGPPACKTDTGFQVNASLSALSKLSNLPTVRLAASLRRGSRRFGRKVLCGVHVGR